MRPHHYLRSNSKVELAQHMIFVDTETQGVRQSETLEHHYLWFGWACYVRARTEGNKHYQKEEWFRFSDARAFWSWVESKALARTKLWVLAHNWNYDAGILNTSTILPEMGWQLGVYINDKPPFILRFRKSGRSLVLVDTLNYFAGSLSDIGESIGIPKLPMPVNQKSTSTWDEYCRRDVTVIRDAFLAFREFVRVNELGNLQLTLASQAYSAYRHRFMHHKILIHGYEPECKLERSGYFGGRVECFQLGEVDGPIFNLDINSQYPYVMAQERYPTQIVRTYTTPSWETVYTLQENYAVMADCDIETTEPVYPTRHDHRLVFPVGKFRTTLATPEFRYALDQGHVKRVHRLIIYDSEHLFAEYVRTLYGLRQGYKVEGNATFQYLCKILLNSLYGKFGQNGSKWQELGPADEPFPGIKLTQETPNGPIRKLRYRMGMVQEFKRDGESANSFPAIAAHVTSYGRMLLWSLVKQAGRSNVLYVDTDSIVCTQAGMDRLQDHISDTTLGALKVQDVHQSATFWGAKDYRLGAVEKHKGIKRNARKLSDNKWAQEKFSSWDYQLSQAQDGYIPIETVTKTLHRVYQKGRPTLSGEVLPLIFQQW